MESQPDAASTILIISGTNRPGAHALKVAKALERHYRLANVAVDLYDLAELPCEVFQPAAYMAKPPMFQAVQRRVLAAAGLHVIVPEYNGSFPGVLKYFIDMLKFPESFDRKPVAYVGEASGMWGALRAVEQLQMVFGYRNAHSYPDRVFISDVTRKFGPDGAMTDTAIDERLARQAKGFAQFAEALRVK